MRYIICFIVIAVFGFLAWESPKCTHVYVAVQQDTVRVRIKNEILGAFPLPYVLPGYEDYDGPELICVKCFHQKTQRFCYSGRENVNNGGHLQLPSVNWGGYGLNEPYDTTALNGPLRIRGGLNLTKPDTFRITYNR